MNRTAAGVIIGFLFMLIAPFIFTEWEVNALMNVSIVGILSELGTNPIAALATWFKLPFQPDASLFLILVNIDWFFNPFLREIIWMTIMAWFSMAFIIGLIAKGIKRTTISVLIVLIVYFALNLMFSVLNSDDLATMLTGVNLFDLLGVLLTDLLFSILGGVIGGIIGGSGLE